MNTKNNTKVVVVGYADTNHYIKDILDGVNYEKKIGINSIHGRVFRHLAKLELDKNYSGPCITHFKRLYVLVGDNLANEIANSEHRLFKKLCGKPISEIVVSFDHDVLGIVDEAIDKEKHRRANLYYINHIQNKLEDLNTSMERDIKRFVDIKPTNNSWPLESTRAAAYNLYDYMKDIARTNMIDDQIEYVKRDVVNVLRQQGIIK